MPEHKLVVVLVNESTDSFSLPDLIACDIYDHLLGRKPFGANPNPEIDKYVANLQKAREEKAARAAATAAAAKDGGGEQKSAPPPSPAPAAYAGEYENPEWGKIVVAANQNSYSVRFGTISSPLGHLTGNTFEAKLRPGDASQVSFTVDPKAGVSNLKVMGQSFARVK